MKKTATKLFQMRAFTGKAYAFRLDPGLPDANGEVYTTVIVSAAKAPLTGDEVLIFPADDDLKAGQTATDFLDMPGSQRGTLDHIKVLKDLGYAVKESGGE